MLFGGIMEKKLTISFTDWQTVLFSDGKEMDLKKFFHILENRIDDDCYGVSFDEKKKVFYIWLNDCQYEVLLNKKESDSLTNGSLTPLLKKLLNLSKIRKMYDIKNGQSNLIISDVMDYDAKAFYLNMLKKNNQINLSKIKHYLENLGDDSQEAWREMKEYLNNKVEPFKSEGFNKKTIEEYFFVHMCISIGLFILLSAAFLVENNIVRLIGSLLIASPQFFWLIIPIIYSEKMVKNRFNTLIDYLKKRKNNNKLIQKLTRSLNEEKKIMDAKESELKSVNKIEQESISKYEIVKMIDEFIEDLKKIKPDDRIRLKQKIQEILVMYNEITKNDNSLEDREVLLFNPELRDKIGALKLEMDDAKKRNAYCTRQEKISYLQDKLETIDDKSEEKGYCKKKTL